MPAEEDTVVDLISQIHQAQVTEQELVSNRPVKMNGQLLVQNQVIPMKVVEMSGEEQEQMEDQIQVKKAMALIVRVVLQQQEQVLLVLLEVE